MTDKTLKDVAEWYYDVCELYEDEDLDPNDHVAVIQRAFASSDCDDFAAVAAEMTGWPTVRATWSHRDCVVGHHTLVRAPDGRLLDVHGWTDEKTVKARYRARKDFRIGEAPAMVQTLGDLEDGMDETKIRIAAAIRQLPYTPFNEAWFQALSRQPLAGVDCPVPGGDEPPPAPGPR